MILILEKEIGQPQRHAVDDRYATRQVIAAQEFLLLDVGPLWATAFLMATDTLTELLVPDVGRGQVDGVRREAQGQFFGVAALARALAAGDEDDMFEVLPDGTLRERS